MRYDWGLADSASPQFASSSGFARSPVWEYKFYRLSGRCKEVEGGQGRRTRVSAE